MTWVESLSDRIQEIFNTTFSVRNGAVVPEYTDVVLKDGAVEIDATFLYADLAGSSAIARICPWTTTAKIIRAYLDCCVRSIHVHGGEVRSFDGDRVMGIFIGSNKCNSAVDCALEIDWMVHNVLNPKAKAHFASIKNNSIEIKHCVGVATGVTRAVRTGIRDANDLIWVGEAPSFAAKLSDIRDYPNTIYITYGVHSVLNGSNALKDLWTQDSFTFAEQIRTVYKTARNRRP